MLAVTVLGSCACSASRPGRNGDIEGLARAAPAKGAAEGPLEDDLQQGEWSFWHPNGQLEARGGYVSDERDGPWTHWYEDGTLRMRGEYRGERQEGLWEFWHPNGQPSCRGEYRVGREQGEWTFWHTNGAVRQRGCFDAGRRALEWSELDLTGRPVARGSYLDDGPVGLWTRLGADGAEVLVEYPLPADVEHVRETWDTGRVRREGFLQRGAPLGPWATRHENGALRATVTFVDGRPAGELATWRDDGTLLARGPLDGARLQGSWLVRGAEGVSTREVRPEPRAPWDRTWSAASIATTEPPLAVAGRWLDELTAPREVTPRVLAAEVDASPPAEASPRLEAPTDPGRWTVREERELALFRRYYRDGWLPRRHSAGSRYGAPADSPRLGAGDDVLAASIVGERLPCTSFPTARGERLDLDSLRGKRVLLVVLRGFTTQVCVYCFAQTAELAPLAAKWRELECEVVVLFPGTRSRMEAFTQACREEFGDTPPPYHMVYDPDLDLARALGLEGNLARPAAFVLDRAGVVQHAYVAESEQNVADRPSAADLVRWVAATR
jgi:antitoxin component YwqK of YwqJK toxin-antitoxin module/peroxiredoxin